VPITFGRLMVFSNEKIFNIMIVEGCEFYGSHPNPKARVWLVAY